MATMKIIFTHRPLKFSVRMSVANAITRFKQGAPFDHVCVELNGRIYESSYPEGVHDLPVDEWKAKRIGSLLFIYEVPGNYLDMYVYFEHKGKKYDTISIANIMLGRYHKLKKNPTDKIFCSELVAMMRHKSNSYQISPFDLQQELEYYCNNVITAHKYKLTTELVK